MEANVGSSSCTLPLNYADEGHCLIDALHLAGHRMTAADEFPLRRDIAAEGFRSAPVLTTDDSPPVDNPVVKIDSPPVPPPVLTTAETQDQTEALKCPQQRYGLSLIHALDLAVDRRIVTTVGPQQSRPLRERAVVFRSSAELSIHSPIYAPVKSVLPVTAEIQPNPAGPDRRRSLWKRSKRFMWKSLVNTTRRICFCRSFVDPE
ncbi:uncharacterized protein LOC132946078 [Metopolophium dirhodum]|uniref:uncharacterized protein LOC132946078 n=1 Tax=Metopolophium dirhodum TaxID=44670 RepID=UPI002990117D|nr:uncharacterized protein LOC132946078 [Metopolophium dirhodum]